MECKLKDITVYYEVQGSGKPVLIIHGFGTDHRSMKGALEPIFRKATGWKRIYFDLPGMGRTKAATWIHDSDRMLEVVLDFTNIIIPDQTFVLVGSSYGAYLAGGVLNKKFDRVDGLLLICPLIIPQTDKRDVPKHRIFVRDEKLLSRLSNEITQEEKEAFESIAVVQNEKIWQRWRDEIMLTAESVDEQFLRKLQEKGYALSFDVYSLEKHFGKPALFIMGRQDNIVGYRDAWKIMEQYPRGSFVILDKAGHILPQEQEHLFNPLVYEWLARINSYPH